MEPNGSKLIERMTQLERQQRALQRANRRLRFAISTLVLLAGAVGLMAQTAPVQSLEAQQFVLRGRDGKVRGVIGLSDNGSVGINLNDIKGQTRIEMDVAPNGSPGLDLYDPDGKLRATFALGPKGTPGLGLYDSGGKLRTSLDVPAQNTPGLAFYHPDGKPAWGAP
jgi:hypothetical protein